MLLCTINICVLFHNKRSFKSFKLLTNQKEKMPIRTNDIKFFTLTEVMIMKSNDIMSGGGEIKRPTVTKTITLE